MTTSTVSTYLGTVISTIKNQGLRAAWKVYGWRLVALVFSYYLIRDTLIYLVLPFLALKLISQ